MHVVLESLNLAQAERQLCAKALDQAGTIIEAASLLGITRHALKRRITKHRIAWPPAEGVPPKTNNAHAPRPHHGHREYDHRLPPVAPDHHQPRPNLRGVSPVQNAMRPSNDPNRHPHNSYGHRPGMDNSRVRNTPPNGALPNMMGLPDLRKYDR